MKKKLCSLSLVLVLALGCMSSASAAFIPDDVDYRELNGQQQAVKVYTLLPSDDPNELREEDFEHDGFLYAFSDMTKLEQTYSEDQPHTETVTVNTSSKNLEKVLEALEPKIEYDKDGYTLAKAIPSRQPRTSQALTATIPPTSIRPSSRTAEL